ncbi:MAG: class I SAM-dependent methyltransferase [Acidobacteriota bacterium]
MSSGPDCRFCGAALSDVFLDLGLSPLANSYLRPEDLERKEPSYPLIAYVCAQCLLVQVPELVAPGEIFSDYAYFSSYSESWVEHARLYSEAMIARFGLGPEHLAVEIASNDGYLLQHLARRNVRILGVEPAANVAAVAREKGIPTVVRFFGAALAAELRAEHGGADLLIGNNVLAHVPALNDFVSGLRALLAPRGVITIEVPHLLELIRHGEFDTIYHEHFSYFSLLTLQQIFAAHALRIFDVESLATHGGSLRIFAAHEADSSKAMSPAVGRVLAIEREAGLDTLDGYLHFAPRVERIKSELLAFLGDQRARGRSVAAYGAPAKGNTLLNFCGIGTDLISFTVDRSPHKQGLYLPGSRIPVLAPEHVDQARPDFLLILPWNLRDEIVAQMNRIRNWGGRFVVAVPELEVLA